MSATTKKNEETNKYCVIPDEIKVKEILFNGQSISHKEFTIPSYLSKSEPTNVELPYKGNRDYAISVKSEYKGFTKLQNNGITLLAKEIINPETSNDTDAI